MAQISYGEFQRNSNGSNTGVGFFSLKNNNDEAVVRFMHDTPDSFDIAVVHSVNIGGKFRNVNCIRDPKDPVEACPLCAKNVKIMTRIFVHLIEYVKSENGTIVPTPKVWERPAWFADDLYNKITEYGPLSQNLFKIKRNGAPNDKNTTYSINYCVPANYPEQYYPNIPNAFDGFSILNFHVLNKNAQEMNTFLETGSFPAKNNQTPQGSAPVAALAYQRDYSQPVAPQPAPIPTPAQPQFAPNDIPMTGAKPWEVPMSTTTPTAERPTRYY